MLATIFILGILLKVSKILKNISLSFFYTVASFLGLVLLFKWIIKPLWNFIKWSGEKLWKLLCWIGNRMIEHYSYRTDDMFWYEAANSMDRSPDVIHHTKPFKQLAIDNKPS